MKRLAVFVFVLMVAGAGIAILNRGTLDGSKVRGHGVNKATEAAYQDGLFLGRLDAGCRRKPHLASGRWATDSDRRLFVAGYLQTYREVRGSAMLGQLMFSGSAGQRGYHDGVADGHRQRLGSGPFHPTGSEHLRADYISWASNDNSAEYKQAYLLAYSNGYQQGYYTELPGDDDAAHLSGAATQ